MTTPNMGITEPVDGGSSGVWGALLNAALDVVDAHDHTTGKGAKVPSAALKINADVSWAFGGTHYAITDAQALDMFPTTAALVAGYSSALWTQSSDSNLYYRNAGGTNVQITSGNTLNVAIAGAIGGDYGSVGALLDFIDANDTYHFYQQIGAAVRQYARVAHGDIDLFEYKAQPAAGVPANRVRIKSPAGLAASYDLTWFAALPAANQLISVDNAGAITAGTSAALTANANITISGTGNYKHGTKTISRTLNAAIFNVAAGGATTTAGASGVTLLNNSIVYFQLPEIPQHARLVNVSVYFNAAADRGFCTVQLYTTSAADPATTVFTNSGLGFGNTGTAISKLTAANLTLTASQQFWVQLSNGVNAPRIVGCTVDYDVP